jgi:hypothetical protein
MLLLCLAAAGALAGLILPATRALPTEVHVALAATAVSFFAAALAFSSLTIRAGDGQLRWHFGPGLVRKSVPLAEIAAAEPTTTTWMDGWGIHLTRRGWLYNVAGHNAVLVTTHDGKQFQLGTDEPAALVQAIRAASGPAS